MERFFITKSGHKHLQTADEDGEEVTRREAAINLKTEHSRDSWFWLYIFTATTLHDLLKQRKTSSKTGLNK